MKTKNQPTKRQPPREPTAIPSVTRIRQSITVQLTVGRTGRTPFRLWLYFDSKKTRETMRCYCIRHSLVHTNTKHTLTRNIHFLHFTVRRRVDWFDDHTHATHDCYTRLHREIYTLRHTHTLHHRTRTVPTTSETHAPIGTIDRGETPWGKPGKTRDIYI